MNIIVANADDAVILLFTEPLRPSRVIVGPHSVAVAIYFNDQLRYSAEEIDDETPYSVLLAEIRPVELAVSEMPL